MRESNGSIVFCNKGNTDTKINIDIKIDMIGSDMCHPNHWIKREEMMTPTDPRASARTWRYTPYMFSLWWDSFPWL